MANRPKNKGHQSNDPAKEHHGSTAEETAALNETFKTFSEGYYKDEQEKGRRDRIKFRIEIGVAIGVALNIALTGGLLIAGIKQLMIMRDTEVNQLRAYVGLTQHGIENFGTENQVLNLTRKNYGATRRAFQHFWDSEYTSCIYAV